MPKYKLVDREFDGVKWIYALVEVGKTEKLWVLKESLQNYEIIHSSPEIQIECIKSSLGDQ